MTLARKTIMILISLLLTVPPAFAQGTQDYLRYPATIVRVIDGDTIEVASLPGIAPTERVRLNGIDTPERANPFGPEATAYTKTLLPEGSSVILEFDVRLRDNFGRYLAYVFLPDGRMVNALLLEAGLAQLYTEPPNVRYADILVDAQRGARECCRGMWSTLEGCRLSGFGDITIAVDPDLEKASIINATPCPVDISGWTLISVVGDQRFVFPAGTILHPGGTLLVVSGRTVCPATSPCIKWTNQYIWNNDGDSAELRDRQNGLIASER